MLVGKLELNPFRGTNLGVTQAFLTFKRVHFLYLIALDYEYIMTVFVISSRAILKTLTA